MIGKRVFIHAVFLFALPVAVAYYGISTPGAVVLVVLALLWRWAISVSGIVAPAKAPDLVLETIRASHFAEKARWCLDKLGIEYVERPCAGVNGVLFRGRSVPELTFRTGIVQSVIGNSAEILRYLWGRYSVERGEAARFLEPTEERLAFEKRLDRYGANLQVWVYYHIVDEREVVLHAWGWKDPSIPNWQRLLLPVVYPINRLFIRRAFRISEEHYRKTLQHIESLLADVEEKLDDGRRSILGGEDTDFVDITFASLSALWLQPVEFADGRADASRVTRDRYPLQMSVDVDRWCDQYPLVKAFIERLYREERGSA